MAPTLPTPTTVIEAPTGGSFDPTAVPATLPTATAPPCPACGGSGRLPDATAPAGSVPCWRCDPYPESAAAGADPAEPEPAAEPTAADRQWWRELSDELARGDHAIADHDGPTDADWADYYAGRLTPGDGWPESEVRQCWGSNPQSLGGPDPS